VEPVRVRGMHAATRILSGSLLPSQMRGTLAGQSLRSLGSARTPMAASAPSMNSRPVGEVAGAGAVALQMLFWQVRPGAHCAVFVQLPPAGTGVAVGVMVGVAVGVLVGVSVGVLVGVSVPQIAWQSLSQPVTLAPAQALAPPNSQFRSRQSASQSDDRPIHGRLNLPQSQTQHTLKPASAARAWIAIKAAIARAARKLIRRRPITSSPLLRAARRWHTRAALVNQKPAAG